MQTRAQEIETAIVAYMTKNPGSIPNYATIGDYREVQPVFEALEKRGVIVWTTRKSATGRNIKTLVLAA